MQDHREMAPANPSNESSAAPDLESNSAALLEPLLPPESKGDAPPVAESLPADEPDIESEPAVVLASEPAEIAIDHGTL